MKHKQFRLLLIQVCVTLLLLLACWGLETVLAQGPQPGAPRGGSPVYTFNYQGRLMLGGAPANGAYDMRFSVWDADTGGSMLGSLMSYPSWPVTNSLFTVNLSPGAMDTIFDGGPRWLQIEVRPGGSVGAYTTLTPRQPITPAPYAWGLMPGASITATPNYGWDGWVFRVDMTGTFPLARAIMANAATGAAVQGMSTGGWGLYGSSADGYAVYGYDAGASIGRGYGGYFVSENGVGLFGQSNAQRYYTNQWAPGVYGRSTDGVGVLGVSDSAAGWMPAIRGESANGVAISGWTGASTGTGVQGYASAASGNTVGAYGGVRSSSGQAGHFVNLDTSAGGNISQTAVWAGTYWGNLFEGWELDSFGNPMNRRFRVKWDGTVYSDNSYNCGLAPGSCFNASVGADVAERIDVREYIGAADVVEVDPAGDGGFRLSSTPFSPLVAGVVSSNPAVTLNNNDMAAYDQSGVRTDDRPLLALVGQVPVKVTDENGAIQPGDLLVTSSIAGHAMRAGANPPPGTVIGKALQKLDSGSGVIKMLVMLR